MTDRIKSKLGWDIKYGDLVHDEPRLKLDSKACILNLDSPSYPPSLDEYRQCGCEECLSHLSRELFNSQVNGSWEVKESEPKLELTPREAYLLYMELSKPWPNRDYYDELKVAVEKLYKMAEMSKSD